MTSTDPASRLRRRLMLAAHDTDRLAAYLAELPAVVESCPTEAVLLATEAYRLIPQLAEWAAEPAVLLHRGAAYLRCGNPAAAVRDLDEAHRRYEELNDGAGMARASLLHAESYVALGTPVRGEEALSRALDECGAGATAIRADALESLGNFRLATSDYVGAIDNLRAALSIREQQQDHRGTGRALGAIGTALAGMGNGEAAYGHHEAALQAFRQADDMDNQIRTMANLVALDLTRGQPHLALERAAAAHAHCLDRGDRSGAASMRMAMGDVCGQLEGQEAALRHYLDAYRLLEEHPTDELLLALYQRIGSIHQASGDLDAARHVFVQALAIAERIGDRRMAAEYHERLAGVLETLGAYREALQSSRRHAWLREEIAGEDQRRAIADLQAAYEREKMEQERRRAESHAGELRRELDAQRDRLADALLNLAQSNAMLEKFRDAIRRLRKRVGPTQADELEGMFREIDREIALNPRADHEWKQIERTMDSLHPGFVKRLFERCPRLTPTEVKICILTRLGHTTAQIGAILDNDPRTIQGQRLKIRRKFDMAGSTDFTAFIANL